MRDFNSNCLLFSPERLETGDKSRRFFFSAQPISPISPISDISLSNIETHFFRVIVNVEGIVCVAFSKVNNAQNFTFSHFFFSWKFVFPELLVTKLYPSWWQERA